MAYANGKIYALRTHKGDEVYVGSTIRTLEVRFKNHKKKSNIGISKSFFEKYNDVYIELIELFPCETKAQLNRREGHVMLGFGDKAINKKIAGLTPKESVYKYQSKNKDKLKKYRCDFYAENCDKLREKSKKYREENKEVCKKRCADYKATDEYKAKRRENDAKKREEINAKQRERRAKKKAEAV